MALVLSSIVGLKSYISTERGGRGEHMNEQEVLQVLRSVGAIITDSHVVCTRKAPTPECESGWFHSATYINKHALYPHTAKTSRVCRAIAKRFADDNVQVVIAPAIGAITLSHGVAHHLTEINNHEVLTTFAEKEVDLIFVEWSGTDVLFKHTGDFVIGRGYDKLIAGNNILVVEDILATGGSAKKVIEATQRAGGNVIGLGVLCNRGGVTSQDVGVSKLNALVNIELDTCTWPEESCPLCKKGVPINTDVGKGREFLARQR